jgi:hypothetical protein
VADRPRKIYSKTSAQNGSLEATGYFLKARQGYSVRKMKGKIMDIVYIVK